MIDYTLPLDELPDPLPIVPLERPFDVTITPPGSKSITNRAYGLAALARGESRIIRPLKSDDTDLLLEALCTLGAEARWVPGENHDGEDVLIRGVGGRFPRGGHVNLGHGGTPTRFMIAAACLAAEPVTIDGSARMRERPIAEGVDMLRQLGAKIEYVEEEGRLPARVIPSDDFKGGEIEVGKTQSSQFISALMLIGPWLERGVILRLPPDPTSVAYIQMTRDLIDQWTTQPNVRKGEKRITFNASFAPRAALPDTVRIDHAPLVAAESFWIDSDASSTVYWVAATLMTRGSNYHVAGLGKALWQPDLGAIEALMKRTEYPDFNVDELLMGGPKRFEGFECDARNWPDGTLAVAVCAAVATGPSSLTGLHTLRVKETDRIAALANELRKVGCSVETTDDSITIEPIPESRRCAPLKQPFLPSFWPRRKTPPHLRGLPDTSSGDGAVASRIVIETYDDHRMAMAFAVLGLVRPNLAIRNPAVVSKSYPGFWKDFAKLY